MRRVDLAAERLTEGVGRVILGDGCVTEGPGRANLALERADPGIALGSDGRCRRALARVRALAAANFPSL